MRFGAIECIGSISTRMAGASRRIPLHRHHMAGSRRLGGCILAVTASDAGRSHLPKIRFFRYLILPHAEPAGDDWASARVTRVSAEV